MTVLEVLNWSTRYLKGHGIENPRLNAELLLGCSLNLSREALYARLHEPFGSEEEESLQRLMERRVSGEPLQYILGHQEFWSTDLRVDRRVLIPRPETELLVEQSLLVLSESRRLGILYVLEIGTGSGAIAIALAKEMKDLLIVATDISEGALRLARENAESASVLRQITFVRGDLFHPFRFSKDKEKGPFDLILSNPPYIGRSQLQSLAREVKDYEPTLALDGGEDGMGFYRRFVSQGPSYLRRGGWLLLEVGEGQAEKVVAMIEEEGCFRQPERVKDLSGIERVVRAQKR